MKILFVSAEAAPIAKVGGLGDVVGALPKVLRQLGHDVRIFFPYYGFLPDKMSIPAEPIWTGSAMFEKFSIYETILPGSDVPLYLFNHPSFNPRNIYGGEDEAWRFTLFSNGAAEFVWNYWKPDVIHCHDWHTAMLPVWMHQSSDIATVFTIHNLAYQGPWRWYLQKITWCPWYMQGESVMSSAIMFADRVTTVSPTYANQIQTPTYGEGLDGLLSYVSSNTVGILNGIDTNLYNPGADRFIMQEYTADTIEKRIANKTALQEEVGLQVNKGAMLVSMVTRLVEQKGIDLLLQILDRFLSYTDAQFLVLGTGDRYYESELWNIASHFPGRMSVQLLYNDALSRRIYSGSDVLAMPSRFEPCGISQMLAMRYGCVPLVRNTGGLVDTVSFHDPANEKGTGFSFDRYEPLDFYTCLIRAWESYRYKESWTLLQQRAMRQDFSWYQSAIDYLKVYKQIKGIPDILTTEEQNKLAIMTKPKS